MRLIGFIGSIPDFADPTRATGRSILLNMLPLYISSRVGRNGKVNYPVALCWVGECMNTTIIRLNQAN